MIKTEFMELLEELDSLYEAPDFYASKTFWADAKAGKLNDQAFKKAFKDELVTLDLWSLIDEEYYSNSRFYTPTHTGALIDKSSYGAIKKAADENPDSWAVKALLKMWVLQFKDGVKSNSQLALEKEKAARAEREASIAKKREEERVKLEAEYTAAKKEWDILNEKLSFIQDVLATTVKDYTAAKKEIIKANIEKALALKTEMTTATKGILSFHDNTDEYNLALLDKEADLIKVSATLTELDERFPSAKIWVKISQFFSERPTFKVWDKQVNEYFALTVEDIDEATIKSKLLSVLDAIWELVSFRFSTLNKTQETYDEVMVKIETAKAAQSEVNAGKPVDPKFVSEVLSVFNTGKEAADSAFSFYSDTHDGSSGAAFAMKKHEAIVAAGIYLVNCNWRAIKADKEIVAWKMTDSIDSLEDALSTTFNAFDSDLTIEIVK